MKWYHKLGIGAGISALVFAAAAAFYGNIQKTPRQEQRSAEMNQRIAELEKSKKDLDELLSAMQKDEAVSASEKPKSVSEKEKVLREYLEKNLDMTEMSKNEYDGRFVTQIAESDGLDFVKYLHDELGLKTVEWSKIKVDSKFYGTNCLNQLASACKDEKIKEKMHNPALKEFLNYWRKFPKMSQLDFSFEKMLGFSKLPLEKIDTALIDEIFSSMGYAKSNLEYNDIEDLIAIDRVTINKAKRKNCPINDLYMLDLIETSKEINKAYHDVGLQAELEERLSKLPHVFRQVKAGEKLPKDYTERPGLSQIDGVNKLRIKLLLDALQNKDVLAQIKELVQNDLKDKKAEHGGVVRFDNSRLAFVNYISRARFDPIFNGEYHPSYNQYNSNGICAYHFHATGADNQKYAGPSEGDLLVSKKYKETGLVISDLGSSRINADLYYNTQEGQEIVVDLGIYDLN